MGVYLHAKFEVFGIIVTCFRQGGNFTTATSKRTPKKSPPRLGLKGKFKNDVAEQLPG